MRGVRRLRARCTYSRQLKIGIEYTRYENGNLFAIDIAGVWFRLDPYSDELYSNLRADLVVENEVVETWLLKEIPHKDIKYFKEPITINADEEYFVRLTFIEAVDNLPETSFLGGFEQKPETPNMEIHLRPIGFQSQ